MRPDRGAVLGHREPVTATWAPQRGLVFGHRDAAHGATNARSLAWRHEHVRSALEESLTPAVAELDDVGLEEEFEELDRAADLNYARRLRLLGEIERRGTYARDGHVSLTSWLARRFRTT